MPKIIPLLMHDTQGNVFETKGKLHENGSIDYPIRKPTRTFIWDRDATIRVKSFWHKNGFGKSWVAGQFVFEDCAQPVHFQPKKGNMVNECPTCKRIPYGIVDPHRVHLLKRGEIQWGLVDAANRVDKTGAIEKYWQIGLLIGGAILAMLVIALFKMGVFDIGTWTGMSILISGMVKSKKQKHMEEIKDTLEKEIPGVEVVPMPHGIVDEFTNQESNGFEGLTSALEHSEVNIQQHNLQEEMYNETNLDQKTRLSPLLAVRLEVAEMVAHQEDLPELAMFCEGLKRKRISIDGESRKEAVQMVQANTQVGINVDSLRRTQG